MHVTDLFYIGAQNAPDGTALAGNGGEFTYAQMRTVVNRLAHQMLAEGFSTGTRFAVFSPNCGQALMTMIGALRAGAAWCNLNLRNAIDDNVHILSAGGCEVLFYHSSATAQVKELKARVPSLRRVVAIDQADAEGVFLDDWIAGQPDERPDFRAPGEGLGMQGATGGTTGRPKLTQADNNWLLMSVLAWSTCLHFDAQPVNLAVTPITHAAGMVALANLPVSGKTVMLATPDLDQVLRLIEEHRVTTLFLPPTLIYALLAHPKLAATDLSSLRYVISAAAPISPDKIAEGVERIGPVMCQSYGQTECGFPLTFISPRETAEAVRDPAKRHRLLSCGRQCQTVEAMEVMSEDGRLLATGEVGEIVMRGPTAMARYLNDEAATAEIQTFGWHHTGDIGYRDADGFFFITDRKRDMIVSGGFNIFPFEIETALFEHPAVQDCAVIGVPDPKWGEAVKAVVQLKPGASAGAEELIAFCKDKLGSLKAPKSIDFSDALPRSPVGKVLKREIRKPYWEGHERGVN
ncbi:class I adenylate-forming enzyme family protein [Chelatococcus reniformis]|uniref:3-methylmercaptopropionyl-CoA ligase n=1 Tax=Chelatococcus reniformis TaxID=1494448 RepID=A0A916UUA4_9HYPH|nr:AMP-binding protein [Chelatococcus reniformis]GGC88219.1 o-succinylbenzoate--CoA ligase [Chelatococcus reniformis]